MIILASSSPRRRELLSMIGLNYVIETSGEEEVQPHGLPPAEFVKTLALQKAQPPRDFRQQLARHGSRAPVQLQPFKPGQQILHRQAREFVNRHALCRLPRQRRHIMQAHGARGCVQARAAARGTRRIVQVARIRFGKAALAPALIAPRHRIVQRTALRARDAQIGDVWPMLRALGHRLRRQPRQFVLPPRH